MHPFWSKNIDVWWLWLGISWFTFLFLVEMCKWPAALAVMGKRKQFGASWPSSSNHLDLDLLIRKKQLGDFYIYPYLIFLGGATHKMMANFWFLLTSKHCIEFTKCFLDFWLHYFHQLSIFDQVCKQIIFLSIHRIRWVKGMCTS